MLKIKLARFGKKSQPHFRIIVNEARSKRDGQYVALLGHYAPTQSPKILDLDLKAYAEWIKKGAQPTETVAALAKRVESGNPFPEKAKRPSKKAIAKAAAAKEAVESEVAQAEPAEVPKTVEAAEASAESETAGTTADVTQTEAPAETGSDSETAETTQSEAETVTEETAPEASETETPATE